jgi:hypothetical protein
MNRESILHLVQAEPERTRSLLKAAGAGAVALLVWSWLGRTVAGELIFVVTDLVAIVAYSTAIVVMTGNLVRDADRWQVESALQAKRLMSRGPRRDSGPAPAGEPTATTFDHWYFVLRLEDEIKRARRYGKQVSVVIMKLGTPEGEPSAALTEQINFDVAQLAANHSGTMTMPSAIGPLEYAFLLPETDRNGAKARVAPLLTPLGDYWCRFGIAVYPDDGAEAETLVELARVQIEG